MQDPEFAARLEYQASLDKNKPISSKRDKLPSLFAKPGSKLHSKKYHTPLLGVTRVSTPADITKAIQEAYPNNSAISYYGKTRTVKYEAGHLELLVDIFEFHISESKYSLMAIPYLVYLDQEIHQEFIDTFMGKTTSRSLVGTITAQLMCDP
jgi:hypothetical protein